MMRVEMVIRRGNLHPLFQAVSGAHGELYQGHRLNSEPTVEAGTIIQYQKPQYNIRKNIDQRKEPGDEAEANSHCKVSATVSSMALLQGH